MKFFWPFIFVVIGVIISTIADIFLKESKFQNHSYIIIGILLYAVGALPVAAAFKLIDFSVVFFIWEAVAVICGLVLGILLFNENHSYLKFLAFGFAILALVFSYLASNSN